MDHNDDSGWEAWPLGCDSVGNPVQDLSVQLLMIGSILCEWMIVEKKDVYIRRLCDE